MKAPFDNDMIFIAGFGPIAREGTASRELYMGAGVADAGGPEQYAGARESDEDDEDP